MKTTTILLSAAALAAMSSLVSAQTPGKIVALESPSSFCILLPSIAGQSIGESEGSATSHCVENGIRTSGSRVLPAAAVKSAHYKDAGSYIQITGQLDLDLLRISQRDGGGQYDDASWGIEPLSSCQGWSRYLELVGGDSFCVRCCKYDDPVGKDHDKNSPCFAGNDLAGCWSNIPGDYGPGFTINGSPAAGPGSGSGGNPPPPPSPSPSPSPSSSTPPPPPKTSSTPAPPPSPSSSASPSPSPTTTTTTTTTPTDAPVRSTLSTVVPPPPSSTTVRTVASLTSTTAKPVATTTDDGAATAAVSTTTARAVSSTVLTVLPASQTSGARRDAVVGGAVVAAAWAWALALAV
ncbi:hypothetical protein HDU96_001854 [Phlyctochytrium bullatum]|nr:hypothetical protein HDU96_001854 [Phlyctochytrium bullatum]